MKKLDYTAAFTKAYVTPTIEVMVVTVEQGFAASVEELGETLPEQVW